ncbi:hypothetical protein HHI36_007587 [Cryptolaemus montrouzieri]|uniref:Uncharacterized protein n=1 Tax=Cryptolaemus montrouzieri TaxID=559131 RepID=A0ABD2MQ01_9CUCU
MLESLDFLLVLPLWYIVINSALAETPPSEDIEQEYSNIKMALKRTAHEALGYEQKRKIQKEPIWLAVEVKQSIDEEKNVSTGGCQIRPTLTGRDTNQKQRSPSSHQNLGESEI